MAPDWFDEIDRFAPQSEDGFTQPGPFSDPRRTDPVPAEIERCLAAERAADAGKTVPLDATVVI